MDLPANAVQELLGDVNHFLHNVLSGESLSERAELERKSLVHRVSLHLPVVPTPTTPPPYLDMNGTMKGEDHVEEYVDVNIHQNDEEFYEESPGLQSIPPKSNLTDDNSQSAVNYENISIPVSKLREDAKKFGPLFRKEKFLFLDHLIRYWAGIIYDVILIYNSEKDTKPSSILSIRGFEARPDPSYYAKDSKKKDCCFEIVCPGKKSHQFIARTIKDMEQWVAAINDASLRQPKPIEYGNTRIAHKRELPSPPRSACESDVGEEYDDIHARNSEYDEEIYHDISDILQQDNLPLAEKPDPPLLPKRPVTNHPKDEPSDHDSVYDDIGFCNPNSVYYNVSGQRTEPGVGVSVNQPEVIKPKVEEEEEEDIYDDIGIMERYPEPQRTLFHQENTNSVGRIHHLIQKMEASLGSSRGNTLNNRGSNRTSAASIPSEEIYEPIDVPEEL